MNEIFIGACILYTVFCVLLVVSGFIGDYQRYQDDKREVSQEGEKK